MSTRQIKNRTGDSFDILVDPGMLDILSNMKIRYLKTTGNFQVQTGTSWRDLKHYLRPVDSFLYFADNNNKNYQVSNLKTQDELRQLAKERKGKEQPPSCSIPEEPEEEETDSDDKSPEEPAVEEPELPKPPIRRVHFESRKISFSLTKDITGWAARFKLKGGFVTLSHYKNVAEVAKLVEEISNF